MYCFITSYTRKTSNELFKQKETSIWIIGVCGICERSCSISTKTKKEIKSFRKTSYEVFETLWFVRFVKRSIWNIVFRAICVKKLKHYVLCDLWKEVFETLCFVRFMKRSIWNIVFCAICEKKLKYFDKDGKRD